MNESGSVLTSQRVTEIFNDCLFRDGEDTSEHVPVKGIMNHIGFHPERLESHREEIIAMLAELPEEFQQSAGGGYTFLNVCEDRHGNQWTGFQLIMEQLVLLGIGLDLVEFTTPRDQWKAFPGGMPYLVVKDGKPAEEDDESAKDGSAEGG